VSIHCDWFTIAGALSDDQKNKNGVSVSKKISKKAVDLF
jgi:hypothetical protein